MNWFSLSGLLTGLACTAMSAWVYRKSSSNPLNVLWAVFCMSVAVWGFGALAIGSVDDAAMALICWRCSYVGVVFIPSLFYHFVCVFLRLHRPASVRSGYVLSFVFLVLIWTPQFFPATHRMFDQFYYANPPGQTFPFFMIFFTTYVLMSHWDLVRYIQTKPYDPRRRQIIWFLTATSLGYAGGSTSFLPIFGLEWYPWGNMTVPLYPIIMTYAIFKHQLMDIQVVLRRTVYYTFFAAGLSLFYVGIVYGVHLIMTGAIFRIEPFVGGSRFSPYSVLPLVGFGAFTALALLVLTRRPHNRARVIFGMLCVLVSTWQLLWLASFYLPERYIDLVVRCAYIAVTLIPAVYLHFVVDYLDFRPFRTIVICLYVLCAGLLTTLRTDLFVAGYRLHEWGYYTLPGPLFWVFVVLALSGMFTGLAALIVEIRRGRGELSFRARQKYLALSLFFFMFCSVDFVQVYGHPAYPLGTIFFLISFALTGYAILKHELLDVRIMMQRTAIYTALTILVSALYLSLVYAFYALMPNAGASGALITGFVGVLFVAAVFKPIEIVLNRALERRFFRGTIGEISELNRQLESELERRERLKSVGILAAGMAHEIKNPLTVIQTFAEHLPAKYGDAEFRDKFHRLVTAEVGRMKHIVEDLLAFSKPRDPERRPIRLDELMEGLILLCGAQATRQRVRVDHALEPLSACVDPDQIKQATLNILMNAIEAMPDGGELIVRLSAADGQAQLSIRDTGCGMTPEQAAHIFDPFYTSKDGGTGLGLAITHAIIEKNGGHILVRSRPGEGATFIIRLPLC